MMRRKQQQQQQQSRQRTHELRISQVYLYIEQTNTNICTIIPRPHQPVHIPVRDAIGLRLAPRLGVRELVELVRSLRQVARHVPDRLGGGGKQAGREAVRGRHEENS